MLYLSLYLRLVTIMKSIEAEWHFFEVAVEQLHASGSDVCSTIDDKHSLKRNKQLQIKRVREKVNVCKWVRERERERERERDRVQKVQ